MDTFNHLAPTFVRALQFLRNVSDEQVKQCRAQILKGKLKYCGKVNPLDPQDLKFPPMRKLDPDKCGETNSGMWQKGIRQDGKTDLRTLRKIWSVGRPYLKCKCKKERNKDCRDTPLWFDHAIWFLLAHPDVLFPTLSSIKVRTSMLIHYLRTTWRDGVLAAIGFHFLRDLMMGILKELEADGTLNAEGVLKEDQLWSYPIPAMLASIMLPTRIPDRPSRIPLNSPWLRRENGDPDEWLNAPGQMITLPSCRKAWKRQKLDCDTFLHLKYTSRVMEPLSVRRLVNEVLSRVIGDDTTTWLKRTKIGWTYNPKIASRLCRPAETFCEFDVAQWIESYHPDQCPYRMRRYMDMRSNWSIELLESEGCTHIITMDSSITDSPLLHGIIRADLNHISCMALDVEEASIELENCLDELFVRVMELNDLSASTKSFLWRVIMKKARAKMEKYRAVHKHAVAEPFEHPAVKRELEFITGRFLICPTDKAPNTPAFGPEFASINVPLAAVIARIRGELSALPALPIAPAALPYLMTVLKAHKGTFWWITNTANTIVSPVAKVCACLLRFLLPLVQDFCQERSLEVEERCGVRPNLWWAIASVGEFHVNLPKKVCSVFTADITRCFETIPTDGSEESLPAAVRFYVQCAMQIRKEISSCHTIRITFGQHGGIWPSWVDDGLPEEEGMLLFRERDICWLSGWCITNSMLLMGDYVWRQVKGIPMGLACSPIWCDIYFFKYEYHAMMRLADTGNTHLIPCFDSTFRYIDDLGAINNAVINNFLRNKGEREAGDPCWVYPEDYIKIKENTTLKEEESGRIANFLSPTITVTSPITGSYATTRYDKRSGLGFSPCRFVRYKSNRSVKQSLQIITAQVAQILLLCSEPEDAANEIAKVVTPMEENGFASDACWRVVKKTLWNAHLYQPGKLSVHVVKKALTNLHGFAD
ncbi:hypothetical protein CBR_g49650 [Chara braunii]|uniref:Reverse transcriptase domain-containing protein n=1 Tax=Chara braunii TaxID=69332 RepID=A0A388M5P2_CHABU|nr:hypothetical protein CBR_g49650 [Chara braunii]|eukprot:GBG89799.1 hypothetical protein CBR_g49650 [Chara braunii]